VATELVEAQVLEIVWIPDNSTLASVQTGYLVLSVAGSDGTGATRQLQIPSNCALATDLVGTLKVGAVVTLLLTEPSDLQARDGHVLPNVAAAWMGKQWAQPIYPEAAGVEDFAKFAESRGQAPFDALLKAIQKREGRRIYEQLLAFEASRPWYDTDPFIRSLEPGDLPPAVLGSATPIAGTVSYSDEALKMLGESGSTRVIVRTQDGVLAAAAVRGVSGFQWEASLPQTSTLIEVWITDSGSLSGGTKIADLTIDVDGRDAEILLAILVSSSTRATITRLP
jgi:hypothetical protein